jgi:hypothetical protein
MRDQWGKALMAPRAGFEPATIRLTVTNPGYLLQYFSILQHTGKHKMPCFGGIFLILSDI